MLATGACSTVRAASIVETALPTSTRRSWPVAVVTTAARFTETWRSAKFTVTGAPAVTVTGCVCSE